MQIQDFKDSHKGERCFILGNGPSLNTVNLRDLDGVTFGTNRIYLSGFTPDYYVAVNPLVLRQFWQEICAMDGETQMFLSDEALLIESYGFKKLPIYLDTSLRTPAFSSPEGPIWEGHTVTYVCLQLAYYMGFEQVILLGVDHDYGKQYRPNLEIVATGYDEGHFHPEYFSQGTRWNAPDLGRSELAYSLAKTAFEKAGRQVINCSASTKLDVFEIQSLKNTLYVPGFRVSAIVSAYKSEAYLRGCLEDLARQTEPVQIVVVAQDGSKEFEILVDLPPIIHDLVVITTPDIPTVYTAWNLGIEAASGKYITNANTDDRHHPKAYEIMADLLDANPGLDLVYHDSFITWESMPFEEFVKKNEGKTLAPGRDPGIPGVFAWRDYAPGALAEGCFIGPQPMWRANLHQRHGYFMFNYKSAGDYEFWLRIAGQDNIRHIPYILGLYHARPDGIEMSDLVLNQEESIAAVNLHQTPEVYIRAVGPAEVLIKMDGRYTIADKDVFFNLIGQVQKEFQGG